MTSTPEQEVGSSSHPAVAHPADDPLAWSAVPGSTRDLVTVGHGWRLTVAAGGASARLAGPRPRSFRAGDHSEISDAFLDGSHALVVSEDKLAGRPDVASLVDLMSGHVTTLDGSSSPPTSVGGTWALGPDPLVHATVGAHHAYCLASVDVGTGHGSTGWCAPPRHGFSRAAVTADGETLMTFDDHRPSCRTLVMVQGTRLTPLPGVTRCRGWDSAALAGGVVWSVVPKDRRIEVAHFYAHSATGWYDLGRGTSGSLVACAGSAYFVRNPGSRTDPATLLRWSPHDATLSTVFASKGRGNAFLSPPRCGGDHLTVTAYSSAGDQQVTAAVAAGPRRRLRPMPPSSPGFRRGPSTSTTTSSRQHQTFWEKHKAPTSTPSAPMVALCALWRRSSASQGVPAVPRRPFREGQDAVQDPAGRLRGWARPPGGTSSSRRAASAPAPASTTRGPRSPPSAPPSTTTAPAPSWR